MTIGKCMGTSVYEIQKSRDNSTIDSILVKLNGPEKTWPKRKLSPM